MTDYDQTQGKGFPYVGGGQVFLLEGEFDATVNNLLTTEKAKVINVPAGTFVLQVMYRIRTGQGAARNFEIGGGANDNWVAATSSQTASTSWVPALAASTAGVAGGEYFVSDGAISVRSNGATLDACKIGVKAVCVRLTNK